jgi:hypothetical protein
MKTAKKAYPKTVANLKLIVEHVWEIQGVKSFMQSLVDGVKPGKLSPVFFVTFPTVFRKYRFSSRTTNLGAI